MSSVYRIKVICVDETWFVKDGAFAMPFYDGEKLPFCLDKAMDAVQAKVVGPETWNATIDCVNVGDYLKTLCQGTQKQKVAQEQWIRKYMLYKLQERIPFKGGRIDWASLGKTVDEAVHREFPACSK